MTYRAYSYHEARVREALAAQRAEREAREAQEAAEEAQRQRENAAARRAILDGIAARKAEEQRREDARIDQILAPRRQVEEARWLLARPGKTAQDFEREGWPLVRTILVAELRAEEQQAGAAALLGSGRYSF